MMFSWQRGYRGMGILQLPDFRFYDDHENDGDITIFLWPTVQDGIHVWPGYFRDVLKHADKNSDNWTGFTRDWLMEERTMDPNEPWVQVEDPDEYIADWKQYADKAFELPETKECYNFILTFLEEGRSTGRKIYVTYRQTLNWKPVGGTGLPVLPDWRFYRGYEGEPELILTYDNVKDMSLHIWDGYIYDILCKPDLSGNGWDGFTRDYQQGERTFDWHNDNVPIEDLDEYIIDLKQYYDREFMFVETRKCLDLIVAFLEEAKKSHHTVYVNYD
ncbi:MAG: hypothetical protein LUE27_03275 [Clostridia bacterium]|nr:hypothetical protein [Clostridia bacterium]